MNEGIFANRLICPSCGAPATEDSKFCTACGASFETDLEKEITSSPNPLTEEYSEKKEKKTTKKRGNVLGVLVGTALIIAGVTRIFSAGTSISSTSFGGDFYTYTYRGIVAISEILASIEVTLGWVVVAIGAAIDVMSLKREE